METSYIIDILRYLNVFKILTVNEYYMSRTFSPVSAGPFCALQDFGRRRRAATIHHQKNNPDPPPTFHN
jgi:hypothetical protein